MERVNLVVAVLQVNREPWRSIARDGQSKTWMNDIPSNVEIVELYGSTPTWIAKFADNVHEYLRWKKIPGIFIVKADRILGEVLKSCAKVKSEVTLHSERRKIIRASIVDVFFTLPFKERELFRYFLEKTEASFLYMTNTSSFVNLPELRRLTESLDPVMVYGGTKNDFGSGTGFASGSNRLLSRDVVERILARFSDWDFAWLDDLAMGKLLSREETNWVEIPSVTIDSERGLAQLTTQDITSIVHFRLKAVESGSRNDVHLMRQLAEKVRYGP